MGPSYPVFTAPVFAYFLRHTECERLKGIHASRWPLSETGKAHARAIGKWLEPEFMGPDCASSRFLVSGYRRMAQTAGHLGLNGNWEIVNYLRPRSRGRHDVDGPRSAVTKTVFSAEIATSDAGESVAQLRDRADLLVHSLYQEGWWTRRALVITAREMIWAIRATIEGWADSELERFVDQGKRNQEDDILNGEMFVYCALMPTPERPLAAPGRPDLLGVWPCSSGSWVEGRRGVDYPASTFVAVRRVSVMDPSRTTPWQPMSTRYYTDEELRA